MGAKGLILATAVLLLLGGCVNEVARLEYAARRGDAEASYRLGMMAMSVGIDGAVDNAAAVGHFADAEDDPKARYLWLRYHDVDPTPEGRISPRKLPAKYREAAARLEALWEREHDTEAAWLLGDFHYYGHGGTADTARAVALWEAAAARLCYPAMIDLGVYLLDSEEEMTRRRGFLLLRKASKYGYAYADYLLAKYYRLDGDLERADEHLRRAAAGGVVQAKLELSGYGEENGYAPGYMKLRNKRLGAEYLAALAEAIHRDHRPAMIELARAIGAEVPTEAVYLRALAGSEVMSRSECALYYPILSMMAPDERDGFNYLELDELGMPRIRRMDWFYILTGAGAAREALAQMYAALPMSVQMDGDATVGIHAAYSLPGWLDDGLPMAERAAEFFRFYRAEQGEEWYYLSYALAASLAGRGELAIYGAWALEQVTNDDGLLLVSHLIRANGYRLLGLEEEAQRIMLWRPDRSDMVAALVETFLPALTAPEFALAERCGIETRDLSANTPEAVGFYDLAADTISAAALPIFAPVNTVEPPLEPLVLD